jgi:hypothetical protein
VEVRPRGIVPLKGNAAAVTVFRVGTLVANAAGDLYGVAPFGGERGCYNNDGCGTVFKLTP